MNAKQSEFYNGYEAKWKQHTEVQPETKRKHRALLAPLFVLNRYFFGVEPDEPIDWASCAIFYGGLTLMLVGALLLRIIVA